MKLAISKELRFQQQPQAVVVSAIAFAFATTMLLVMHGDNGRRVYAVIGGFFVYPVFYFGPRARYDYSVSPLRVVQACLLGVVFNILTLALSLPVGFLLIVFLVVNIGPVAIYFPDLRDIASVLIFGGTFFVAGSVHGAVFEWIERRSLGRRSDQSGLINHAVLVGLAAAAACGLLAADGLEAYPLFFGILCGVAVLPSLALVRAVQLDGRENQR